MRSSSAVMRPMRASRYSTGESSLVRNRASASVADSVQIRWLSSWVSPRCEFDGRARKRRPSQAIARARLGDGAPGPDRAVADLAEPTADKLAGHRGEYTDAAEHVLVGGELAFAVGDPVDAGGEHHHSGHTMFDRHRIMTGHRFESADAQSFVGHGLLGEFDSLGRAMALIAS